MTLKKALFLAISAAFIAAFCNQIVFSAGKTRIIKSGHVKRKRPDSQTVVFSSQCIDLSDFDLTDPEIPKTFSVNVIFGKAIIVIDPATKLRINVNPSLCASVTLPDGTKISSGDGGNAIYEANLEDENGNAVKPQFLINANATFGSITVIIAE